MACIQRGCLAVLAALLLLSLLCHAAAVSGQQEPPQHSDGADGAVAASTEEGIDLPGDGSDVGDVSPGLHLDVEPAAAHVAGVDGDDVPAEAAPGDVHQAEHGSADADVALEGDDGDADAAADGEQVDNFDSFLEEQPAKEAAAAEQPSQATAAEEEQQQQQQQQEEQEEQEQEEDAKEDEEKEEEVAPAAQQSTQDDDDTLHAPIEEAMDQATGVEETEPAAEATQGAEASNQALADFAGNMVEGVDELVEAQAIADALDDDALAELQKQVLLCQYKTLSKAYSDAAQAKQAEQAATIAAATDVDEEAALIANMHHHAATSAAVRCDRLQYRLARHRRYRAAMEQVAKQPATQAGLHDMASRTLSSLRGDGYADWFNKHALARVPLHMSPAGDATDAAFRLAPSDVPALHNRWQELLRAAAAAAAAAEADEEGATPGPDRSASELAARGASWSACCAQRFPGLLLPNIMQNDYIRRLEEVTNTPHFRRSHSQAAAAVRPLLERWPVLRITPAGSMVPLAATPHGMHCLVHVLSGSIDVHVFGEAAAQHMFPRVDGSFSFNSFNTPVAELPAQGWKARAGPGHVVFVPAMSAASWATSDGQHEDAAVLQYCFVDASNLNTVKSELSVDGLVDGSAASWHHVLQQSNLNVSMLRQPEHLTLAQLQQWPRHVPTLEVEATKTGSAAETAADAADATDATDATDAGDDKSRGKKRRKPRRARARKRARRSGGRLKAWQAEHKWHQKVKLLTVPAPSFPDALAVGRSNITLKFDCPLIGEHGHAHDGAQHDKEQTTIQGYLVVWNAVCLESHEHPSINTSAVLQQAAHALAIMQDPTQASANVGGGNINTYDTTTLSRSLAGFDVNGAAVFNLADQNSQLSVGCGRGLLDQLCVPLKNLSPSHTYRFKVAAITTDGPGSFSDTSAPITTTGLTTPGAPEKLKITASSPIAVRATWQEPADDGGSPIIGYLISSTAVSHPRDSEEFVVLGPRPTASVGALQPGESYRFKLLAINAQGVGPYAAHDTLVSMPLVSGQRRNSMVITGVDPSVMPSFASKALTEEPTEVQQQAAAAAEAHEVVMRNLEATGLARYVVASDEHMTEVHEHLGIQDAKGVAFFGGTSSNHRERDGAAAAQHTGRAGAVSMPAPKPLTAPTVELVPCFGPVGEVSDVQQSVTIKPEDKEPITLQGWTSAFSPQSYLARAELIAAQPLTGIGGLRNKREAKNRIVVFQRGEVTLRDKALAAAQAGALAVVVVDNGVHCDAGFSQLCVPGADKARGELFAAGDKPQLWQRARIPMVLLNRKDGQQLLRLLA